MNKNKKLLFAYVTVGILGRLIPHPANITPMTSLSLFAGCKLSRKVALLIMGVTLLLSDMALAVLYGYPLFGLWTLFSYSGFAVIILLGPKMNKHPLLYLLGSTIGFWLWTNFGAWLWNPVYAANFQGLINCYIAGLPFLRNACIGNLIWMVVIFGMFLRIKKWQLA